MIPAALAGYKALSLGWKIGAPVAGLAFLAALVYGGKWWGGYEAALDCAREKAIQAANEAERAMKQAVPLIELANKASQQDALNQQRHQDIWEAADRKAVMYAKSAHQSCKPDREFVRLANEYTRLFNQGVYERLPSAGSASGGRDGLPEGADQNTGGIRADTQRQEQIAVSQGAVLLQNKDLKERLDELEGKYFVLHGWANDSYLLQKQQYVDSLQEAPDGRNRPADQQ